jgi:hypothetical protein
MFQAAAVAALAALVAAILQAVSAFSLPSGVQIQPGYPVPLDQFVRATNEHTGIALGFFGADSLFIISYLVVFIGLYLRTVDHARPFAQVGLLMGVLTAVLDATENAYFITYALGAKAGLPLTAPDLPLVYVITNLKWMAAFATLLTFGLVHPRRAPLDMLVTALMLLFPLVGVLGVANPDLIAIRGLFFLIGMPLFAFVFWRQSQAV